MADMRFDDRLDVDTELTNLQALAMLRRALKYVYPVRHLYLLKGLTMAVSLIPYLIAPWPIKIIVDHALLAQPIVPEELIYPSFIEPFVVAMVGFTPMEVLLTTLSVITVIVFFFGLTQFVGGEDGPGTSSSSLAEGEDNATRAENQASAGWSLAGGIWGYLDLRVQTRLAQTVTHVFRSHLFRRLLRLPMTTLDDSRVGDAIYRVMYDTPALPSICFELTITPLTQGLLFVSTLVIMQYTYMDAAPELVYIALVLVPLLFLIVFPFSNMYRKASQDSRASGSATTDTIEESMSNIGAVQGLGANRRERERFDRDSNESFRQFRKVILVRVLVGACTAFAGVGLLLYAWYMVSEKVISGVLTPGDYGAVLGLYLTLSGVLGGFARIWYTVQDNVAGARRVFFFIDMETEADLGTEPLPPIQTGVEIEHVDFVYPDGRQALFDISFEARVGEVIAITGPTGAGKTSLAYLVPGFIRPSRGRVLIDRKDIADVDVDSLREQVAYVFQENLLFSSTVAENIGYGNQSASREDIERAARLAGAHDFIMKLPNGYDTPLGRGGNKLSVGQKQRACIARGLVRDAKILILDEPTSALDPETEAHLVDTLKRASQGRLVLVIAHRLSTIRGADRIVFMQEGRIVESGSHGELLARTDGAYRRFVELQSA